MNLAQQIVLSALLSVSGTLYTHPRDFFQSIEEFFGYSLPAVDNNPYAHKKAVVRYGTNICDQEKKYLNKRKILIKQALKAQGITSSQDTFPCIAVSCSGGGYRAMLYATGALKALDAMGLLNAVTYVLGLSGSTWAIAPWISSGSSISDFHDWLCNNCDLNVNQLEDDDFDLIEQTLATKYWSGQPIGFVDIYGACLANNLLDFFTTEKDQIYLSEQSARISNGSRPFPIYTAISGQSNADEQLWYEFTPYEVGTPWLNAYIPTWAFGRSFSNGVSTSYAPEQPLGTLMGTFGLAVGVSVKDLFQDSGIVENMKSEIMQTIVSNIIQEFGNDRPLFAAYLNFVAGIAHDIFETVPTLDLVDAGINYNLPYLPVSGKVWGRTADIIIFVDASAGTVGAELQKVESCARANNLPFPAIDYTQIGKHAVSVFVSNTDAQAPIIIYIPRVVDSALLEVHKADPLCAPLYPLLQNFDIEGCIATGVCNTFNFLYTPQEARRVTALGECNTYMAYDAIMNAIKRKI